MDPNFKKIWRELRLMGYDGGEDIPYVDVLEICEDFGIDIESIDLEKFCEVYDVTVG